MCNKQTLIIIVHGETVKLRPIKPIQHRIHVFMESKNIFVASLSDRGLMSYGVLYDAVELEFTSFFEMPSSLRLRRNIGIPLWICQFMLKRLWKMLFS